MRAVTYIRVSTEEQKVSGLGLEDQRRDLRQAVELRGWELVHEAADEGVSAKIGPFERPGLRLGFEMLIAGEADVLMTKKVDRLARSTRHLLDVLDHAKKHHYGLTVLDLDVDTTTGPGRFVATLMGSVAELERTFIVERTRSALAVKKSQGARLGRPTVISAEIRTIVSVLRSDGRSLQGIADHLNKRGMRNTQGGLWSAQSIFRVLQSIEKDHEVAAIRAAATTGL